jgi:hypothetical protein
MIAGRSLPGFFSIAVATSSDRGWFVCCFSFNFCGCLTGEGGQYFMANNYNKKIRETLYNCTVFFLRIFLHIKPEENLTGSHPLSSRYQWELVKSAPKILIFKVCSGGTQPVSSSILAGTLPGKAFFIISIFKQSSWNRRRQRIATPRYRYDLYRDPPAIVFLQRM